MSKWEPFEAFQSPSIACRLPATYSNAPSSQESVHGNKCADNKGILLLLNTDIAAYKRFKCKFSKKLTQFLASTNRAQNQSAHFCNELRRKHASCIFNFSSSLRSKVFKTTASERFNSIWYPSAWILQVQSRQSFWKCQREFEGWITKTSQNCLQNDEEDDSSQWAVWIRISTHRIVHVIRPFSAAKNRSKFEALINAIDCEPSFVIRTRWGVRFEVQSHHHARECYKNPSCLTR